MRTPLWLAVAALAACTVGPKQIAIGPPPARLTQVVLAGPLCAGDHCECRELTAPADGGAGMPEGKQKRFEIRIGPSAQEEWVTIGHDVLYKNPERTEECFYVDLPAGDAAVELRASEKNGVSAAWTIRDPRHLHQVLALSRPEKRPRYADSEIVVLENQALLLPSHALLNAMASPTSRIPISKY
jgi:hypothetical protein